MGGRAGECGWVRGCVRMRAACVRACLRVCVPVWLCDFVFVVELNKKSLAPFGSFKHTF